MLCACWVVNLEDFCRTFLHGNRSIGHALGISKKVNVMFCFQHGSHQDGSCDAVPEVASLVYFCVKLDVGVTSKLVGGDCSEWNCGRGTIYS